MSDEVLTIKEVADYLKVNERTIYRLAARGDLPGFRVGNAWRFRRGDLNVWVSSKTGQAKNQGA
ncbi:MULTISPECIES: helix-turn-helix domain-containing protein [Enterobacteriaceae]|uniref:helix-turn-helix domain-containing protein n=1 Tax=Klebsiella michiganensis TaxID=1134687 RepID=UPI000668B897|nr:MULTISPECIES: helix-turn-helix domain-containing protein [Enterobacteriaceae]HAE8194416.1 helix-turn-helix domain-containing protein [Salmonella enterica subsp. indica serovar 41:b:1,7]HAU3217208.1 helix-turn-helix domain-containing protein [Salmonella enterica subsp. indica]